MNLRNSSVLFLVAISFSASFEASAADRVKTANGIVEAPASRNSAVRSFKGIPFAQPPTGDLRWREPQPVKDWKGVRSAAKFGPTCMQRLGPNADYWFRGDGMSEDCLYLNVWTPAKSDKERLPVLVYIFGGGFQNGDGSEPRYDGESMATNGMVAVSVNYRTNIFGFFSHPELTKESPHHASGNYGLLDQVAALEWVAKNIAAFGGDPKRVTIAGESAGSVSVSALMASPLSRNLIAGAIGESGAMIATLPPRPLADAERDGLRFGAAAGASSLAALRAMTAQQIQEAVAKSAGARFSTDMDGYFLAKPLTEIFAAGEQAKVPLLAGSNSEEQGARSVLQAAEPTPESFVAAVRRLYGDRADQLLKVYAPSTREEVLDAATDLASTGSSPTAPGSGPTSRPRRAASRCIATCTPIPGRSFSRRSKGAAAVPHRARRGPFRRNPIRHGQSPARPEIRLGTGRPQGFRDHAGVLCELRQNRQPEWRGVAGMAGVRCRHTLPDHAA